MQTETKPGAQGFLGGSVIRNRPPNAGDKGWIPDAGGFHMPPSN